MSVVGPVLNVAAVALQDGGEGHGIVVNGVPLPVWYPDADEAARIAGRVFDLLQPGHEMSWEAHLERATPIRPNGRWRTLWHGEREA